MPSVTALDKLLTAQLGRYLRAHPDSSELPHVRIVDSTQTQKNNIPNASNVSIVEKLPIYAVSCGTIARGKIRDLGQKGIIILVTTSSGLLFHVELHGVGTQLNVARVSTGAIAKDLKKAIERTNNNNHLTNRSKGLELRIFRVAGMHVSTVWLHRDKKPEDDVFVPYTPNFAGLRVGRIYKLHRIESLLKKYATYMILRWYDRHEKGLTQPNA